MKKLAVSAGVAAFAIGTVSLLPATQVTDRVTQAIPALQLYEVAGQARQGQVGELRWKTLQFNNVQWDLSLIRLLIGTARFTVTAESDEGELSGFAHSGLWNTGVDEVYGPVSVKEIAAIYGLRASGQAQLDIEKLRMDPAKGLPTEAYGIVTLNNLRWALVGKLMAIGDIQATITTTDDVISVELQDLDANIELSGTATLAPSGEYSTDIALRPRASAERRLSNYVRSIGKTDPQGWVRIKQSGNL